MRERVARRLDATGRYPRAVLLVALTGLFATTFPVTVLTLAIPTIAEDFAVSEASLAWVITLPVLASALALPVLGKLGDLYGHRRVFVIGFGVAVVATCLTATASTPALLIAWRTLSQVAGASTMPSSLALINSVHHGKQRASAMGWWSMISAGAPVIGLTVGAPVIDAVGWPTLFLLQSGLMVVPVAASWLVLRETPRRLARFDLPGAVALAAGVGPLLLAVDQAPEWGLTSVAVLGCLVAAVAGLLVFAAIERQATAPLVPMTLLRSRESTSSLATGFFTGGAYMGGFFLASLLVVAQFDYSLTSAVPILSIRPALFALMSPVGGRVAGRAGTRAAAIAGSLTLAAGMVALAIGSATGSLVVVVVGGFVLQGMGFGLLRPAITTALADAVDERDLGMAGAAERLTGQVGVAFGITILATIYDGDVDRFAPAFAVGAAFALAGTVAAWGMRRHVRPGPITDEPSSAAAGTAQVVRPVSPAEAGRDAAPPTDTATTQPAHGPAPPTETAEAALAGDDAGRRGGVR
ncbi:MAG: MFS transporter [Acidimicrobiales bacterium]|nr:MFS transporter [Acidimicrobiales bacterium]